MARIYSKLLNAFLAVSAAARSVDAATCSTAAIKTPSLFGASILSFTANKVNNFTSRGTSTSFCNVSITYTHPGEHDTINVGIWLPDNWNGRFQGVGGGGFSTGLTPTVLLPAAASGWAAAATDGGHGANAPTSSWALVSPGNVNLFLLQDFASVALDDMTTLGKQVIASYFGTSNFTSYWNGCSTGGRQGLMMAQRYPTQYDGILAQAPAVNWAHFVAASWWPMQVMDEMDVFPDPCELTAITAAAIDACDDLDGLRDGVISVPGACTFDANDAVGKKCNTTNKVVTQAAADIANSVWQGARSASGAFQWYGLLRGTTFSGLADTICTADGACRGVPFSVLPDWIDLFVEKNPDFNITAMSQQKWDEVFHASVQQFTSIIGTRDPDLSQFRANGGKMITWHGLADQLIFPNGTVDYFNRVLELDPDARDFYRFFTAPGVMHCGGGAGAQPIDPLDQLVQWVEQGNAPDTLPANHTVNGTEWRKDLCQFPLSSIFQDGDPALASSYQCI